jgi:hypothetical protein
MCSVLDFVFILFFVWGIMILGFWVINSFIVPFNFPGIMNGFLTGFFKVIISTVLVLLWLWIWRDMVRRIFWRAISRQFFSINSDNDKIKLGKEEINTNKKKL